MSYTEIKVNIASTDINISCQSSGLIEICRPYYSFFEHPDITIKITVDELNEFCNSKNPHFREQIQFYKYNGIAIQSNTRVLEPVLVLKKMADEMLLRDTILMHGAVVSTDEQSYMFTAPCGTGKTTRIRLWVQEYQDSIIVNGDKPFIKFIDDEVLSCGSPWCGKEGWNTNIKVPLRAIFLLERADEGETSTIEEVSIGKAFPFLLQQTYRPSDPDSMRKTIMLLKALDGKVKLYKFRSTPTSEAIRLAYETARPR